MNDYRRLVYRTRSPGLIARVATAVVAAAVLVAAFFLGLFVFAVLAGLALIFALVFGARVWWTRRWLEKQLNSGQARPRRSTPAGHDVFEGEFREVPRRGHGDPRD